MFVTGMTVPDKDGLYTETTIYCMQLVVCIFVQLNHHMVTLHIFKKDVEQNSEIIKITSQRAR